MMVKERPRSDNPIVDAYIERNWPELLRQLECVPDWTTAERIELCTQSGLTHEQACELIGCDPDTLSVSDLLKAFGAHK